MAATAMGSSVPHTMARGEGWDSMAPVKRAWFRRRSSM